MKQWSTRVSLRTISQLSDLLNLFSWRCDILDLLCYYFPYTSTACVLYVCPMISSRIETQCRLLPYRTCIFRSICRQLSGYILWRSHTDSTHSWRSVIARTVHVPAEANSKQFMMATLRYTADTVERITVPALANTFSQ